MADGRPRWRRRLLFGVVGAVAAVALVALGHLLLFNVGFAHLATRGRFAMAEPALLLWALLVGGALGSFGRNMLAAATRAILPTEASDSSKLLFGLGAAVALLAVAQYNVVHFLLRDPVDLPTFLLAARAIAAGRSPYEMEALAMAAGLEPGAQVLPYLYLPLYAVLLVPLAAAPLETGYAFVLVGNAMLWALLIYLSFRIVEPEEEARGGLLALALVLTVSFLPAIQTLHHGSPSLLVAVLVAGGLLLERDGKSKRAGLLIALAVLIKVVPALVVAYLLFRKRWRVLLWAAVAGVALTILSVAVAGVGLHLEWLTDVAPGLATGAETGTWFEPACHVENQSLTGVLCRLLGARTPSLGTITKVASLLAVALAAIALLRRKGGPLGRVELSLVLVTMLLASTITWFHHMTLMFPVILTLFLEAAARTGRRRALLAVVALGVALAVGLEYLYDPWPFVGPNLLTRTLRFQAMLLAYATLVVLCLTARPPARSEES